MTTPRKTRIKVGVIGLGIIGSRVAANLRASGNQVYVWSRSPHAAPNFLGSVVEVADLCDVIQIFVGDDAALLEVIRTIAAALSPRHLLAAHPTVSPKTVHQAASIVESQGARYLDCPFTGSKAAAQNKQLVYYVGGDTAALEEIRPVLEASSKQILHVGKIGDATTLKIATNMLTASTVQTLSEMLAVVRAAGIADQRLVEVLEFNASRSATADLKLSSMIAGNFEPNFSLKHMLKDVRHSLGLAEAAKVSLPLMDATAKVFSGGMEQGWGDEDFSVVAKNYDALKPVMPKPIAPPPDAPPDAAPAALSEGEVSPNGATGPSDTRDHANGSPVVAVVPRTAPIGGDPNVDQPKKNTLRVIRDFFKPAQS